MPALGVLLLAAAAAAAVVVLPLEAALGTLLGCWLYVPGTLAVPHAPHLLYVDRLVLYAFVARLVARSGFPGEPRRAAYRPGAVHLALLAYVAVGWMDGVVLAPARALLASDLHSLLDLVDQLVLFTVVLAVARTVGVRRLLRLVAVLVASTVAVAVCERLWLHHGWSHFLFEHLPSQATAPGAASAVTRGGSVRSQVGAQFALEYGWVLAMALPLSAVVALGWWRHAAGDGPAWRRVVPWALPAAVLAGVALTASRSAEVGVCVGVVILAVMARDRRTWQLVAAAGGAVLLVSLLAPSLVGSPFTAAAHSDSVQLRLDRLPDVLALVVGHPFTGVGFNAVQTSLPGLDDSYALLYGTLGVIGLLAWLGVVTTAVLSAARACRARAADDRLLAAAVTAGIVLSLGAAASYDAVVTYQSTWALVILAAGGTALAEAVAVPSRRRRRRWALRLAVPVLATAGGFAVLGLTPPSSSQVYAVYAVAPWVIAESGGLIDDYTGKVLANTECALVTAPERVAPGTSVRCVRATDVVPASWDGLIDVRVAAATPARVQAEARRALSVAMPVVVSPAQPVQSGKPGWAETAPLWTGAAGLALGVLWPGRRRRRRAPPGPAAEVSVAGDRTAPSEAARSDASAPVAVPA